MNERDRIENRARDNQDEYTRLEQRFTKKRETVLKEISILEKLLDDPSPDVSQRKQDRRQIALDRLSDCKTMKVPVTVRVHKGLTR